MKEEKQCEYVCERKVFASVNKFKNHFVATAAASQVLEINSNFLQKLFALHSVARYKKIKKRKMIRNFNLRNLEKLCIN